MASQNVRSAVEKKNEQPTVSSFLEQMKPQISRALPRHMNADRLARIALTEVRRTPLLGECTPESFGGALMTIAQLGLEPGAATGEAYLIPFKNTKAGTYEVQLIIGYKGMAKLYWQSPLAKSLDAQAVHENDHFDFAYGLEPRLEHKPALSGRGQVKAYYAVATLTSGGSSFVVLSPEDVEAIRRRSKAKDDGPWKTDYDAMAKKTCVRQLFKLLPKSPELTQAEANDGAVRTDISEDAIDTIPGEVVDDDADARAAAEHEEQQAAAEAAAEAS